MTLARLRDQARRWARVHSTWTSGDGTIDNAHLNELVQIAVDQMALDVKGFPVEEYPAISAEFTTRTHMGFHLLIKDSSGTDLVDADIALTTTDRDQVAGATVAADLQATLRAASGALGTETVTWSSFAFAIDLKQGATFTFSAPTSVTMDDVRDRFGLTGYTESGTIITSAFPQDCTVDVTLPSDCISIERVEWDGRPLEQVSRQWAQSPEASASEPWQYHVRGRELNLLPSPTRQGTLHVWYKGSPPALIFAGYQECGLTGVSDEKSTALSTTTAYKYKIAINGSAATEYTITTAADVTYAAVIILMNAQNTGATWNIVGGDLRCTSNAIDGVSTIAVTAGSSPDLLATLAGGVTMETAVTGDTDAPDEIPSQYHHGIARLIASYLREEIEDRTGAGIQKWHYDRVCNQYIVDRSNMATEVDLHRGRQIRSARVTLS